MFKNVEFVSYFSYCLENIQVVSFKLKTQNFSTIFKT